MQAAPVEDEEERREDREWIGGSNGIENSRDRFDRVEEALTPDL